MQATILLFALAKEKAGSPTLAVELPQSPTVGDLKAALARSCPALGPLMTTLRIAINREYSQNDQELIPPGAELAAIPPVSGGSAFPFPQGP